MTAIAATVATLTGCTKDEKPVTLPSLTPTSASPTSTTGLTDEEQIRIVYTDYARNWYKAQDLPRAKRARYLAKWTVNPHRSAILDGLTEEDRLHQRLVGDPVSHIFNVRITGSTAEVDDCTDGRKVVRKNTETGKIVERFGHYWYVAGFKRTGHGWRMYRNSIKDKSCVGK